MTYTLTKSSSIVRDQDRACIPADPENRDYRAYLAWVAEGGIPNPAPTPEPEPVPDADKASAIDKLAATADLTTAETVAIFGNDN